MNYNNTDPTPGPSPTREGNCRRLPSLQDRIFQKVFEQAEIARYSREERREYEASIKNYWDYYSAMKTATDKAIAKGRAEGRAEERRANALKMKADNMPVELIAKYTGLSAEEIAAL